MVDCSRTEIEHLLRARYCLIYTVSHEEGRVEATLRELAAVNQNSRTPRKLYLWSITDTETRYKPTQRSPIPIIAIRARLVIFTIDVSLNM